MATIATQRSIKSRFSEENIHASNTAIEIIFPKGRTRDAAKFFIDWLKKRSGKATKNAVSRFADDLQSNIYSKDGVEFKYSRTNFYMTILRTLLDLGFISKNVPIWDDSRKKTLYLYTSNIFDIPQRAPSIGFWKQAYYVCKKWNEMFK